MRWILFIILGVVIAGSVGFAMLAWRGEIAPRPEQASTDTAADPAQIEAGARLALLGNCAGCHTVDGGGALAGGLPIDTPFGTVHSTNITPDRATGIGDWSLEAYTRAMREGVDREGRHLYPAFPYEYFARITDSDLADLYAWNMAQPAVAAQTPPNDLVFPAGFRPLLAGWKLLFHSNTQFAEDPTQSEQWNTGAYLAQGLGHCSACHVPRNLLGGTAEGRADEGGEAYDWWAPPLTAANPAPNVWTEASLAAYLHTGRAPGQGVAAGPMASVVHDSLALAPEADSAALAHYMADRMARQDAFHTEPAARLGLARAALDTNSPAMGSAVFEDGAQLFSANCTTCHHAGGPSGGRAFPDLSETTTVAGPDARNLVHAMLWGIGQDAGSHDGYMPRFAHELTDAQIAAIATHLRDDTVTADTVTRLRAGGPVPGAGAGPVSGFASPTMTAMPAQPGETP
ncbi:cytochrome c [Roseicyclus mahoneyensis]|uniref:Mono/diheme cytochrome c family protein n=1 Tax=Roseicyclus mahoneyensis TaxID=164332 RepID=A0A316GK25_9RHOB|nr:cytochrome c [Roseicyclus mahoneyensis]PWK61458.1 mono/diheme cytochrome c family protein [Roseicyclus mahoneyensis]